MQLPVAQVIAAVQARLRDDDCRAIWLAGSYATGDPGPYSDIDIGVISRSGRRSFLLESVSGYLCSISTLGEEAMRAAFADPGLVGAAVPGWRQAVVLFDPEGCAAAIQQLALAWTWDEIAAQSDAWCAARTVRSADDVLKLRNALARGSDLEAAQRCGILASGLALVASVQQRVLYGSERHLASAVNAVLGPGWAQAYAVAIGARPASVPERAAAAFSLFESVVERCQALDQSQRAVVALALAAAR